MMRRRILALLPAALLLATHGVQAGAYEDFFRALKVDDGATVANLLRRGFDPNARTAGGEPALLLAQREKARKAVAALLAAPGLQVNAASAKGETALMLAALQGDLATARALIERDADVNQVGWTPLHYAASSLGDDVPAVTALLLEHHAYIDAASPNGTTPLMMAVRYGRPEVARLLVDEGADPAIKNELGLDALAFAQQAKRPDMHELILQAIRKRQPNPGQW